MVDGGAIFGVVLFVALVSGGKELMDFFTSLNCFIRLSVQIVLNAPYISEIITTDAPTFIPHDILTDEIFDIMKQSVISMWCGGVHVIGAPIGSGKSTSIRDAV